MSPLQRFPSGIGVFARATTTPAPTTTTTPATTTTTPATTTTTPATTTTTPATTTTTPATTTTTPATTTTTPATTTTTPATTTTTAGTTTTTAGTTTTTAGTTTTTSGGGPGPCEAYVFTQPTCNGEDSYIGYYSKTRRQNPAGSGIYEDCTSATFDGYGACILSDVSSCGGAGGNYPC